MSPELPRIPTSDFYWQINKFQPRGLFAPGHPTVAVPARRQVERRLGPHRLLVREAQLLPSMARSGCTRARLCPRGAVDESMGEVRLGLPVRPALGREGASWALCDGVPLAARSSELADREESSEGRLEDFQMPARGGLRRARCCRQPAHHLRLALDGRYHRRVGRLCHLGRTCRLIFLGAATESTLSVD